MMSGMTVMNCSHVLWPSGGDAGNFIIQSFPPFLFWLRSFLAGRSGNWWFRVTLKSIQNQIWGSRSLPLLKFWWKQLVTFDTNKQSARIGTRDNTFWRLQTGTMRNSKVHEHSARSSAAKVQSQIISTCVYRTQTELRQVRAAVKASPRS